MHIVPRPQQAASRPKVKITSLRPHDASDVNSSTQRMIPLKAAAPLHRFRQLQSQPPTQAGSQSPKKDARQAEPYANEAHPIRLDAARAAPAPRHVEMGEQINGVTLPVHRSKRTKIAPLFQDEENEAPVPATPPSPPSPSSDDIMEGPSVFEIVRKKQRAPVVASADFEPSRRSPAKPSSHSSGYEQELEEDIISEPKRSFPAPPPIAAVSDDTKLLAPHIQPLAKQQRKMQPVPYFKEHLGEGYKRQLGRLASRPPLMSPIAQRKSQEDLEMLFHRQPHTADAQEDDGEVNPGQRDQERSEPKPPSRKRKRDGEYVHFPRMHWVDEVHFRPGLDQLESLSYMVRTKQVKYV